MIYFELIFANDVSIYSSSLFYAYVYPIVPAPFVGKILSILNFITLKKISCPYMWQFISGLFSIHWYMYLSLCQ